MNEIFLKIYNETESSYSDFEDVVNLFYKWKDAQKDTTEAYNDLNTYKGNGLQKAIKAVGYKQALKTKDDAYKHYTHCKDERDKAKAKFLDMLDDTPDLTSDKARSMMSSPELAEYLKTLEDNHVRINTEGLDQKEGLPHVNEKIRIEIDNKKLSPKIYDFGDKRGSYLNVTDATGLQYSMFVTEDLFDEIKNNDIYRITGTVKEIKDFYGKDQIVLKNPKIDFYPINFESDYNRFDDEIEELSAANKLVLIQNEIEVPKSAKLYMICSLEDVDDDVLNTEDHKVYRDKATDKYYYCIVYNSYDL